MLKRLAVEGFKSLAQLDVELAPLTVIVGPNGCGKTSVLEAIHLLGELDRPRPQERINVFARLYEWAAAPESFSRLITKGAGGGLRLTAELEGTHRGLRLESEEARHHVVEVTSMAGGVTRIELPVRDAPTTTTAAAVFDALTRDRPLPALFLQLETAALAEETTTDEERPAMGTTGRGLPSVLAALARTDPDVLQRIQADVARVVPRAGRFRMPRKKVVNREPETLAIDGQPLTRFVERTRSYDSLEVELAPIGFLDASLLSEGTLRTIGIITAIHTGAPGFVPVVLFDDVDRALHPRAQAELIGLLRGLMHLKPGLQIVCTTHSPYLLDAFRPEEVRVMSTDANGHARCRRLDSHPEWPKWRDAMKAGEFWSSVGDDWVATDAG